MIKKLHNFILIILFCLAVFAVPACFFLQPKADFSEREKRSLAEAPDLSAESLLNGTYTEKLSAYLADHFPGRELFVGINAYWDLFSGRQETKDYLLTADGRLFAKPVTRDDKTLNANLEAINAFSRQLAGTGADIPVSLMLVPASGAVLLDDPAYPDREVISYAYSRAETGCVDLLTPFCSAADPGSLYYRTDHHWTSDGAFEAVCAYRRSLGLSSLTREDYTRMQVAPFYGSAYSASGLWLTEPDSLELWYSGQVVQVENETGAVHDSVYYSERLEEQDKYRVFLDGNHARVRIENLSRNTGEEQNLLVIRDSFSNSLGCFLADLYDKVILLDMRYYKLPLTELLVEENISEILIEYSVDNFLHDANLAFLSFDPEPLRLKVEEENRPPNYLAPPQKLTDEFFDDTLYLGDSVNGIMATFSTQNAKLLGTTISSSAMLSYHETANLIRHRLIYKGNYATLPEMMDDLHPRMLISALGCNDLATYEMDHCKEMVVAFLNLVREIDPDITIFIQSVMPIRVNMTTFNQEMVDAFNAWLKESAEEYDYCYIELAPYFKDPDGQLAHAYMYNATHIKLIGAPIWYKELMNIDNYFNFPKKYYVEYDGTTHQPVEKKPDLDVEPEEPEEPEAREETILDEIYARICAQVSCPDMLELNERTITSYLGLQPGSFLDGRYYLCANNLKADEIWLVELEDEAAAQQMLSLARERIAVKAASYDKYLPEESEIAARGITVAKGRYAALFISPDAEAMREVFLSALNAAGA